jgi:CRP/FNR family transcriptional regulator
MKTRSAPKSQCASLEQASMGCFAGLSGAAAARLARDTTELVFKRGQTIFHAGAPSHVLYVIRAGRVKVSSIGKQGEELVLRLLGPGEVLGFRPLLSDEPHNATGEAVEDTTLCVVPAATLKALLRESPEFVLKVLTKLARELRITEEMMMDLLYRPARQRVAGVLLKLVDDNSAAPDPLTIASSHLRRKDMASMAGTTPETLSRILRSLADHHVLTLTRDRVHIRDRARLERIAH